MQTNFEGGGDEWWGLYSKEKSITSQVICFFTHIPLKISVKEGGKKKSITPLKVGLVMTGMSKKLVYETKLSFSTFTLSNEFCNINSIWTQLLAFLGQ